MSWSRQFICEYSEKFMAMVVDLDNFENAVLV